MCIVFLDLNTETQMIFVCIVMPYYESGDLDMYINSFKTRIPEKMVVTILLQMCSCLKFLHDSAIIHRDIKPANVFIVKDKNDDITLKIGDFGLASQLSSIESMKSTVVGTPSFIAPELMSFKKYNSKVDIFALGCLFYKLLTKKERVMYLDLLIDKTKLINEIRDEIDEYYSSYLCNLLIDLLVIDPIERPTASIVEYRIKNKIDKEKNVEKKFNKRKVQRKEYSSKPKLSNSINWKSSKLKSRPSNDSPNLKSFNSKFDEESSIPQIKSKKFSLKKRK